MFYYSLPVLFNDIQIVSPAELLLISLAGVFLLTITAPSPNPEPFQQILNSYLLVSWLGGSTLRSVFWPFFLLLNISLLLADMLVKAGEITVSSWDDIHFILILPIAWWTVSIWRCSVNVSSRVWSALARAATLAVVAEYVLKLVIRIDYPRIFFNCEGILLDYNSCF